MQQYDFSEPGAWSTAEIGRFLKTGAAQRLASAKPLFIHWAYIGIMEKKMSSTIMGYIMLYRGNIGGL